MSIPGVDVGLGWPGGQPRAELSWPGGQFTAELLTQDDAIPGIAVGLGWDGDLR